MPPMARSDLAIVTVGQTVAMDIDEVVEHLSSVFTHEVATEAAVVFGDQPVFPAEAVIDLPDKTDRRFPGWPSPVLVLSDENQGVCSWGVPIGQSRVPVLVGGDITEEQSRATVEYAPDVDAFIGARRWDRGCLERSPVIQAQAAPIDGAVTASLRTRYRDILPTTGWPGRQQFRFEDDQGTRILLWVQSQQCDWWISARSRAQLKSVIIELADLSNLRVALWSNDQGGDDLLRELAIRPA